MRESYFSDPSELYLQNVSVSILSCIQYVSDVYFIRCMAAVRETKESPMEVGFTDLKEDTHVAGVRLIGSNQGPHGIYLLSSQEIPELTRLSIEAPQLSRTPITPSSGLPSLPAGTPHQASRPMPQSGTPSVTRPAR